MLVVWMDKFSWSVTMLFSLQGPLVKAPELSSKLEECLQHLLPLPGTQQTPVYLASSPFPHFTFALSKGISYSGNTALSLVRESCSPFSLLFQTTD